jgi:thiamine-monophosphate kinase
VSGTLGDAGAGLAFVSAPAAVERSREVDALVRRFEYPSPRVQLGLSARGIASAAMDLSDGLSGDLPKLAQASGVAAHVDVERLPISLPLRAIASEEQSRDWALSAGDDYELLLAVPPERYATLKAAADRLNLTLTIIGEMRPGTGVTWSLNGKEFVPKASGYDHFGRATTQITV